jgi:SecD/SecF fusion protein
LKRDLIWRALAVIIVLGGAIALVVAKPVRLGLDLRGGTQIVLEAQGSSDQPVDDDAVTRTLEVLRRRVDQLGVSEPSLQRSGDRRIIIELPGVADPEAALEVIGRTAQLTFHSVVGPPGENQDGNEDGGGDTITLEDEEGQRLRLSQEELTGDAVGDARAELDPNFGTAWQVAISFRDEGAEQWAQLTGQAACEPAGSPGRRIAIVLDREILSSPEVDQSIECDEGITGGDTVITGDFTEDEAKDLAVLIRAGALPVPVEVVEQRTVGPTLGDAAIDASVQAAIIGGLLTMLYMIAYYRLLGVLASVALVAYGVISFAALLALDATLTLPGIAGFVLAIGMAVDANVLVFERGKEEYEARKRLRASLSDGFKKAWSAIADSNATTLLAAIILFYFASGAVRGFGLTLTVGVLASMFTALFVTRILVELTARTGLGDHPGLFGMGVGRRLRKRLEEHPIDVMGKSKYWFALSGAVFLIMASGLVIRGLNFGLDFTGGRLIEYSTQQPADLDEVRSELASAGFPRAVVQETGEGNVSVRTAELTQDEAESVQSAVAAAAGETEVVRDEFIGPTIGDELRRNAVIALGIGLAFQLIYLAIRFRWTFGAAAVVALVHDVVILLGLFAWLGKDIDGVFVAALLTVIGYSINDSVVVFDRIREQRRHRQTESFAAVTNDACLHTIPRTINTGLGAMFVLAALYFLGGDTLTDFALALIVGILIGTYSSVFTASPAVIVFDRLSPAPTTKATGTARPARRPERPAAARPEAASDEDEVRRPQRKPTQAPKRAGSNKRKRRRKRR